MGNSLRIALFALAALVHASGFAKEREPLVLTPDSKWTVNYADDSCRLARSFSNGSEQSVFLIDQFEPGPLMNVLAASKAFRNYANAKVRVSFGPSGATRTIDQLMGADFGAFGPAVMANSMTLIEGLPVTSSTSGAIPANDTDGVLSPVELATPAQEEAITWFEVKRGSRQPVRFALGPMRQPMAALRTCTEELLSHWGIDTAAHKTLSRKVTPRSNPGTWVSSRDYPSQMVTKGVQGVIQFRLLVDRDGKVTSCHIQQSTRPAEFDKRVCDIMSTRARFDPALDASGEPIASYWRSSFRFMMP